MEKGHLQNSDPRPKRRIDKDNPYRIFTVGIETSKPRYFVRFKDGNGSEHCLEVEERLFNVFDQFELDDLSYMNEVDNNHERSVLSEASLNKRAFAPNKETEEVVFSDLRNGALHNAIMRLPEIQRRRLLLYYFGGLTQQQIADIEGCGRERVRKSIAAAKTFLKKFLVKDAVRDSVAAALAVGAPKLSLPAIESQLRAVQERQMELMRLAYDAGSENTSFDAELRKLYEAKAQLMMLKAEAEHTEQEAAGYDERMGLVSGAIELDSGAIEEYDDIMVRQLISNIKVLDKETILVRFKDGTEIQQRIERTKGARVS